MTKHRQTVTDTVRFLTDDAFSRALRALPWQAPIEEWKKLCVRHLDVKRGVGRHPVVFVQSEGVNIVVKELGFEVSLREIDNYKKMLQRGIHTLVPIGCVVREEPPLEVVTPVGLQYDEHLVGHTVTLLVDRVVPDSQLYRRAFRFENRRRIWDAIVDLFVELHVNGVYWGDASLANTLVKFLKVDVPYVGKKTQLKAYLADAETVEIHRSVQDPMRRADVSYFLESMEWLDEDLRASGVIRDPITSEQDRQYITENYERLFEVGKKAKEFESRTGLEITKYLGIVRNPEYLEILQTHIEEHKWYMSERMHSEITYEQAARDWLESIFVPICSLFRDQGVLRFFPGKTASELYVEIMTNKYYLSKERGRDVGMMYATRDYVRRFGEERKLAALWRELSVKMMKILGVREQILLGAISLD